MTGSGKFIVLAIFLFSLIVFYHYPSETTIYSTPISDFVEYGHINVEVYDQTIKPAVTLSPIRPQINPLVMQDLSEPRVRVLINAKDESALNNVKSAVVDAGGIVKSSFSVGNVVVVDVPSDKVAQLATDDVVEISSEQQYDILVDDRIVALGIDRVWNSSLTGNGIKIAIVDTGVSHDNISVVDAKSFVDGESVDDFNGHGTHVAGVAQKVAPGALILNAKAMSKGGSGTTSTILAAIEWAVDNGADILSLSLGGKGSFDGPLASALKTAIDRGVVVIVASGNCRSGCGGFFGVTHPGNVEEVITVGAVDDANVVAKFSSGDSFEGYVKPDVVSPGVDIVSYWNDGGTKALQGTSMSAPFVSGVVALLLENNSFGHFEVKERLISTAIDLGSVGADKDYGAGLVSAELFGITPEIEEVIIDELIDDPDRRSGHIGKMTMRTSDNDSVEDYEGYFVASQVNKELVAERTGILSTDIFPDEIRVKIRNGTEFYKPDFHRPNQTLEVAEDISASGYVYYTDDYSYFSSTTDGIVWTGGKINVELKGEESGTMVECFDWCGDGEYDHCFAGTPLDLYSCLSVDSDLYDFCDDKTDGCATSGKGSKHLIDMVDGDTWTCDTRITYFAKCDSSPKKYTTSYEPFYVVDEREYDCNSHGGTYADVGYYKNGYVEFDDVISCSSKMGCDNDLDDSKADFGSNGASKPSAPCSLKDGYGSCSSDSACLSDNCDGGVCCAAGKIYDGSDCITPPTSCTDSDGDGYGKYTSSLCTYSGLDCVDTDSTINPGALDVCGDGKDNDCDGLVDETCPPCTLTSASWSTASAVEGTPVTLTIIGDFCAGKPVSWKVYESECFDDFAEADICDDVSAKFHPAGSIFSTTKASTTWTAEYLDDGLGSGAADWYFVATVDGKTIKPSTYIDVSKAPECEISDAYWSKTSAREGDSVSLTIETTPLCNGLSVSFDVYDVDCPYDFGTAADCDDEPSSVKPSSKTISGGKATSTWTAEWIDDGLGSNPDWYFVAKVGSKDKRSSEDLVVSPACNNNGVCESSYESFFTCYADCKLSNGASCSKNSDCISGRCDGVCKATCEDYDGDGYGLPGSTTCKHSGVDCNDAKSSINPGASEVCDAIDNNCNLVNNEGNVCCDNGFCDNGETPSSCSTDCFGKLEVVEIVSAPSSVIQGSDTTIKAKIKNVGTWEKTLNVEAAIVPDYWEGVIFGDDFGAQSYHDVAQCCSGNNYYDAKEITLGPSESETVTFTIKAPTFYSKDSCSTNGAYESAWSKTHKVVVGLYTACGVAYSDKDTKSIVVNKPCNFQSDCNSDYEFCKFSGYSGNCELKTCDDSCTAGSYFCSGNTLNTCADSDGDGCFESIFVDYCSGINACDDGLSSCKPKSTTTTVSIANAGDNKVFKQVGDKLKLLLHAKSSEEIELDYDPEFFTLLSDDCDGVVGIDDDLVCEFSILEGYGPKNIGIKSGNKVMLTITNEPSVIFVTNKAKLYERYAGSSAVASVISKLYALAASREGVVYDLDDYISGHPWKSFGDYDETATSPLVTNNIYTSRIASFIQDKCNGCDDVIVVGDDFVVPQFRISYTDVDKWYEFWQSGDKVSYIYSNEPYIPSHYRPLADIDGIINQRKSVIIVSPDEYQDSAMDDLVETLEDDYNRDVEIVDASDVDCSSKFTLGGSNLILVGNREDNNAIQCTPWFAVSESTDTFDSSLTLERNVWATDGAYAIVVSGTNPSVGLSELNSILNAPEYYEAALSTKSKVYLYEVGNPPDSLSVGEFFSGYVMGDCEAVSGSSTACTISDFAMGVTPVVSIITDARDAVLFCFLQNDEGTFEEVVCGASSVGVLTGVGEAVPVVGVVADTAASGVKRIAKTLGVIFKGAGDTASKMHSVFKANIFGVSKIQTFLKTSKVTELDKGIYRVMEILSSNSRNWVKAANYFDEGALKTTLKTVDDLDNVGVGIKKVMGNIPSGKLEDTAKHLTDKSTKLEFLKNVGGAAARHSDEVADDLSKLQQVPGVQRLAETISKNDGKGFLFEAKASRKLADNGADLKGLSVKAKKPDNPSEDLTDIDAISKDKLFEFKGSGDKGSWADTDVGSADGKKFVEDMKKKFKDYGTFMSSEEGKAYKSNKRVAYFDKKPNAGVTKELVNIGWEVDWYG